jgi:hypothetical protein
MTEGTNAVTPQIYRVRTVGGEVYHIVLDTRGVWKLSSCGMMSIAYPKLEELLFTLGGMVEWDAWTEDAQYVLRALNKGAAI